MIDNQTYYTLLLEKTDRTIKRMNRIVLLIFVAPIIYFLLQNSLVTEIKIPLINIRKLDILVLITPVLYSFIVLYFIILKGHNDDLISELTSLEKKDSDETTAFKSAKRRTLLLPLNSIIEVIRNTRAGGCIGCFGFAFSFFPILIILIFVPIIFLVYTIYYNFTIQGSLATYYKIAAIMAIWISISAIVQSKSKIKSDWKIL